MQTQHPTHLPILKEGAELSSPIRQLNDLNSLTPKLPKVSGNNLYNLPPPPTTNTGKVSSAPQAHHSRNNSLNNIASNASAMGGNLSTGSGAVNSVARSATSTVNSTAKDSDLTGATSAGGPSDLSIGFTSPKKITPLEAFTPERGSKSTGTNKLGIPGMQTNQSSPAFWNFVQFSTPNGQTPMRKDSEGLNEQGSPTLNRKQQTLHDNSPLNAKNPDKPSEALEGTKRNEVNA